ncbi:hypothetical protein [Nonomuraea guangzhouensis]|uniref:Uncharacterized protein n=1 Tax=Nonomuraea guangzhouensis TaxID=1291555 RepID=A0ABW4H054_9ACTN|nr:hypothetical protein [Nonomuraea guangzhouensis]
MVDPDGIEQLAGFLADVQGWQDDAEQASEPTRTCAGLCVTAYDVGVFVDGNPVAYPHPDCPVHGENAEEVSVDARD